MAVFKTLQFLPEIFSTDTNRKFLHATTDQLVSEPDFTKVNGYIGRKLAPSYKSTDSYITEPTKARQDYQLEPSVIVKNDITGEIEFATTYTDILNKINYYGGYSNNHSRLFDNEFYSYNPQVDLDKFVNFAQYYWLPNGPDTVTVTASTVPLQQTFNVTFDSVTNTYKFSGFNDSPNPIITLARGGRYVFQINEPGNQFYIQSGPSSLGVDINAPNLSTRSVFGVSGNGQDVGSVVFQVPLIDSQDNWTNMTVIGTADYATNHSYQSLQGCLLSDLETTLGGIDGPSYSVNGASVIFVNTAFIDDVYWHNTARVINDTIYLDQDVLIPFDQRNDVYQIFIYNDENDDPRIYLTKKTTVINEQKVRIVSGATNAGREFYSRLDVYSEVPAITATLNLLYYQSDQTDQAVGGIQLIDPDLAIIDPDLDIVGQKNYVSPNGVVFTNGLKIAFDSTATESYAGKTFYVEGVGDSIKLVAELALVVPEDNNNNLADPDYLTINRSSIDLNGWSRSNRWFHVDVIEKTAEYLNIDLSLNQSYRAQRPILEFYPDIQLFNFGTEAKAPVDLLDDLITNAYTQVQGVMVPGPPDPPTELTITLTRTSADLIVGRTYDITSLGTSNWASVGATLVSAADLEIGTQYIIATVGNTTWSTVGAAGNIVDTVFTATGIAIGTTGTAYKVRFTATGTAPGTGSATDIETITINDGDRIIFSQDENLDVRNKIFTFSIVEASTPSPITSIYRAYIQEADDAVVEDGHTIVVNSGNNGQKQWHYNGTAWIESQQKTAINQAPLFDVINSDGVSFSDFSVYNGSQFPGTKIFSYKLGTGTNDTVLGFPLSYKNLQTQGDIEFENNLNLDTFSYLLVGGIAQTVNVNTGFLQKNRSRTTSERTNNWIINNTFSKQYQIFNFVYDGSTNLFPIDILPDLSVQIPNIKVVINNRPVPVGKFAITKAVDKLAVLIDPSLLTVGDVIFVNIYNRTSVSSSAFYQIPVNLDVNSLNIDIDYLTLGQVRNHLIEYKNNSLDIVGEVPGDSNLRDIYYLDRGGSILQHSAPLIYSGLFLNHPTQNLIDSLRLASREYNQFKIKFLELAANLNLDTTNTAESVDAIMAVINAVKNDNFPWFYSDMIPHGDDEKITLPAYRVFDTDIRSYEITNIFQDTVISNKAVFVYLTRTLENITTTTLLIKGQDYYFDQTRPAVVIQDTFNLLYNDILTVVEYNNTDGSYVPETPTKLGLYPKFIPEIYLDNTYQTPTEVIQGHDGSITPAFGDFRDQLLLELERRIYNNVKVEYDINIFNINDYVPGKFRLLDYTLQEYNELLAQSFLRWVGTNRVNYSTNDVFTASNAFTWNYKNFRDVISAESLPGTWRSVFRYFFDTDRPHTNPWEMLGFSEKPDYWNDRYGPAPYTGGNFVLWSDLESGYIHAGARAGIDLRYSRPGLTSIIPVDDSGNLRPPSEFLVTDFSSDKANTSYAVGDIGPTELAWRRSSDFPYAVQYALAIGKPARYFSLLADVKRYNRNTVLGQFLDVETNKHLQPGTIRVNGYTDSNGQVTRSAGYINWIRDYVKNTGVMDASDAVKNTLNSISVQLAYKMAGYSDKKFLELLAEQVSPSSINDSVIIPDENYAIELYKGAPLAKVVYSAVIVERTTNGYTVSGYNVNDPFFNIIPSLENNNAYKIRTSSLSATIFKDSRKILQTVPYGFEFSTTQQVVDFLVSYQRHLLAQGFTFDDRENLLNENKNWILSAKEFLHWVSQGWKSGNIIVLSPISDLLKINTTSAVIDEVVNTPTGSRVLDINYKPIVKNEFTIVRDSNEFVFRAIRNQSVGFAEFNLVQYEHILVLDNQTVFRDVIYLPESGNRQYRIKIIGAKTNQWNGSVELPGYVYSSERIIEWSPGVDYFKGTIVDYKQRYYTAQENISAADSFQIKSWKLLDAGEVKTGVLNNLATNASQALRYYDINDQPIDEQIQLFSNGLIGFRPRQYFTNLGIDITTQSKFYQGLIKQSGSLNAINALKGARFNNLATQPLNLYENWAIRVGEYGSTDLNQYIEFILSDAEFDNNPAVFQVVEVASTTQTDVKSFAQADVFKSNFDFTPDFLRIENTNEPPLLKPLPVAGFVNLDDIDATVFDIKDTSDITFIQDIGVGYTIWTAKDLNNNWNVFRATNVPGVPFLLRYNVGSQAELGINTPHGLAVNDLVALTRFDERYDGIYKVDAVVDSDRILITIRNNLQDLIDNEAVIGNGVLYLLKSSLLETPIDLVSNIPYEGYITNDTVWVENLDNQGNWGVYRKTDPWGYASKIQLGSSQYVGNDHFGRSVAFDNNALFLYGGAPDSNRGRVSVFARNISNTWDPYGFLTGNNTNLDSFGKVIATATVDGVSFAAVGAPDSTIGGVVYIFENQILIQILANDTPGAGDQFGASIAMSDDAKYLYIGSPGTDKLFCYTIDYPRPTSVQIFTTSGAVTYTLSESATYPTDFTLNVPTLISQYFPYVDYTLVTANQGITAFTHAGTAAAGTAEYYGVAATGGAGSGAVFFVERSGGTYTLTIENAGTGYVATNTLTIPGTSVGGASPANNITITVGAVNTVYNVTFASAPAAGLEITVIKRPNRYTQFNSISGVTGANYGSAVACNATGQVFAIGASTTTVDGLVNAGSVDTWHVTIAEIIANGITNTFTFPYNFGPAYRVYLNDQLIYDIGNAPVGVSPLYTVIGSNTIQYGDPGTPVLPAGNKFRVEFNQIIYDQTINPQLVGLEGSKFGSLLAMCNSGCNIYVSSPNYKEANYTTGLITRYLNIGRVYGEITGTVTNPTVNINDQLSINNVIVTFTGTTLTSVINNINAANIPGITASNSGNRLKLVSDVVVTAEKLNILNGNFGVNALSALGLSQYKFVQNIKHPDANGETFGTALTVDQTINTLAVGSDGADISIPTTFDADEGTSTTFDGSGTKFVQLILDSGAVYLYNLMANPFEDVDNPALFAYSQKLSGPELDTGFNFGAAIALRGEYLTVGVSNDYDIVTEGGSVYFYYNQDAKSGWTLVRNRQPRVDIGAVNSAFIYNKVNENIIDFFDYLDPAKGKLLGVVDQELDFKEDYDPASYDSSNRSDTINNTNFYWSDKQIGKTWLDLTTMSFIDYEQDTIQYRSKNWASLFPGSRVTVYEWVESNFLPSQYATAVGTGVAKYADDTAYSSVTTVDPITGIISQKYYYWVSGKTTVDVNRALRTLSAKSLESYITNPKDQDIPYLALLNSNAVAVYNIDESLSGDDIVLHLDTSTARNTNLIHNEWQLVQQGADAQSIPSRAIVKLRDSLVGFDDNDLGVPDPLLPVQNRLGILSNPRQSMLANRLVALQNYVETLNGILIKNPILLTRNPFSLYVNDPLPTTGFDTQTDNVDDLGYLDTEAYFDGYKVLITSDSTYQGRWSIYSFNSSTDSFEVSRLQSYRTTLFWTATDWYVDSYQFGKDINFTVDIYSDTQALSLAEGNYVKILDSGQGTWLIYEVLADGSFDLIAAQNGTVQINSSVYDVTMGAGYDSIVYDTNEYDSQPVKELQNIYNSVYQEILIDDLGSEFNTLFLTIINYIFAEQKNPDWIFKTSFIDVYHTLRQLEEYPNYIRDNQSFYNDYIDEVKPYRTIVREYVPVYDKLDVASGDWTDFDLPSSYDSRSGVYRSPEVSNTSDAELFTTDLYSDWYNNYKFKITDYILGNIGLNYLLPPNVEITGGGGSGASAITTLFGNGRVSGITVISAGSGYTSTPNVFINGDGVGATAYPLLKNEYYAPAGNLSLSYLSYNLVRSVDTTLKFDRLDYTSNLILWQPNTAYANTIVVAGNTTTDAGNIYISSGNIIVYNNQAFLATNANVSSQSIFDFTRYSKIDSGNVLLNAVDRIVAYYEPEVGMPGKNINQLVYGTSYPGSYLQGPGFRANAFEVSSNIISFNYEGLTIDSGNIAAFDFVNSGFEVDQSIRIEANVPFNFQNNGYFTIVNVNRDSMTLTGQPVESTWNLMLDNPVTANVGEWITQANNTANAYILESVVNSQYLSIIYSTPAFVVSEANVVTINGVTSVSNIAQITTGGNVDVKISYLDLKDIIDSNVYSTYLDSNLGLRPQDINIVGGAYVDLYSSHAPEELIPGRMYDAMEMRVFGNTVGNTATYGYRVFQPMSANIEYTRISANATTTLAANLNLLDDEIVVTDASKLPTPGAQQGNPGIVFINGERIVYYQKYDYNKMSTAVPWTANTNIAVDTLIALNSNVYLTTGNVYANANSYVNSANIQLIKLNSLRQLRRGVDGTGVSNIALTGNTVSDSSLVQLIPNAQIFSPVTVTGNVTVTANVTFKLVLSTNITANIGDYITQFIGNTGNARILGSVISSNVVAVGNVTGIFQTAANTGTRVNIASLTNGVSSTTANVLSITTLGSVNANGNVVLSSTPLLRSNIWEQFSTTLQNSTTVGAQFIRAEPSYIP